MTEPAEAVRWCFADQLGPHFTDSPDQEVLLVESTAAFRRRVYHRRKAHLVLSALRHRVAQAPDRVRLVRADTYAEALREAGADRRPVSVCDPTSFAARRFVARLAGGEVSGISRGAVTVLPERGFAATPADFDDWVSRRGRRRLLLEDFYREQRVRHQLLLEPDGAPVSGVWNLDADNRLPPPKGARQLEQAVDLEPPWWPVEDAIDAQVREDLDRMAADDNVVFVGEDGPRRFAVTHDEARAALEHFVAHRLAPFGPYEDAMLAGDRWMSHSLLSVPLNLGLLEPVAVARAAERAHRAGRVPLSSAEGFIRQVVGWRDYVWHMYWHGGPMYRSRNSLVAREPVPAWFDDLDAAASVGARCLSDVLEGVRQEGWVHHIPRLMVLGNWASQRGYDPDEVTTWFHTRFVDGYEWVMAGNVVGMALHADGGQLATKPYVSGGAYIDRMSDYCGGCRYDPKVRVGPKACPFTAGYWAYLDRNAEQLAGNQRMSRALGGLARLRDRDEVVAQESSRGASPP